MTAMMLAAVLTAPICEELFFGVLWVGAFVAKVGRYPAVACSLLFFAAIHYPYFGIGGVIFIGAWSIVLLALFL
jgi:membrane protease YdiL (CAAX protease family)